MDVQNLFSVRGRVVLVTGGSRGIGLMIARGFVENGAKVYISSRSASVCASVAKELNQIGNGGSCISIPADLSKEEEAKRLIAQIQKNELHLDVLVNNAGAVWAAPLEEFPEEAFEKVMNLNLKKVFTLTRLCVPLLAKAGTHANPARIINIGSVDGIRTPVQETYPYSASKAALHHLTAHLASILGPRHITVNAVAPGPFESKMMKHTLDNFSDLIIANSPLGRIGAPEDMAGVCIYLSSKAGAFVTGTVIVVDGGAVIKSKI